MEDQLIRTRILYGESNMEKLRRAKVAIFGIGGVGGYVAEALARSGIGSLVLVDHDKVALSNLNRQIIALHSTIGRYKTEVMAERIQDIDPEITVEERRCFYLPQTADQFDFTGYSYVVDAVDTVTAKLEIIQRARKCGVPVISSMGAGNKTDPSKFQVADLMRTSVCPLARVMRRECRKRGIQDLKVVYSAQKPVSVSQQVKHEDSVTDPGVCSEDSVTDAGMHSEDSVTDPGMRSEDSVMSFGRQIEECARTSGRRRKDTPGSTVFAPAAAGLLLASAVVEDLIKTS